MLPPVCTRNGISFGSAVFAQRTAVPNTQTYRLCCSNSSHLPLVPAMRATKQSKFRSVLTQTVQTVLSENVFWRFREILKQKFNRPNEFTREVVKLISTWWEWERHRENASVIPITPLLPVIFSEPADRSDVITAWFCVYSGYTALLMDTPSGSVI